MLQWLAGRELRRGSGWRFLVLDLNDEWPGRPVRAALRRPIRSARNASQARRALDAGEPVVLVRPGIDDDDEEALRALGAQLAKVARLGPPTVLVLPEAHLVMGEGKKPPAPIRTILHRWRHPRVKAGLWWDTQNFRDISKEAVNCSTWLYAFGAVPRDLKVHRENGGRKLEDAVSRCGDLAAQDQPGWHVRLRPLKMSPPYELRRVQL
jgi:hypothetical protein